MLDCIRQDWLEGILNPRLIFHVTIFVIIGLSLYQKICDLKIEQIAVQIPNKEKAIRTITTQIEISKENCDIVTLPKEKEATKVEKQEEVKILV